MLSKFKKIDLSQVTQPLNPKQQAMYDDLINQLMKNSDITYEQAQQRLTYILLSVLSGQFKKMANFGF